VPGHFEDLEVRLTLFLPSMGTHRVSHVSSESPLLPSFQQFLLFFSFAFVASRLLVSFPPPSLSYCRYEGSWFPS